MQEITSQEIVEENSFTEDLANPYEQALPNTASTDARERATQAVVAMSKGDDLTQAYDEEPEQVKLREGVQLEETVTDIQSGAVELLSQQEGADLQKAVPTAKGIIERYKLSNQSEVAPYLMKVMDIHKDSNLSQEDLATQAVMQHAIVNLVGPLMDEMGVTDYAGDVGNMLVIPDEGFNWGRLYNMITNPEGNFADDIASAPIAYNKLRAYVSTLSPKDLQDFLPVFFDLTKEVESTNLQRAGMLMALIEHDNLVNFGIALEGLGFVAGGLQAIKGVFGGLKTINTLKNLSKLNPESAVDVAEAIAKDVTGDAAKGIGANKYDAGSVGNPIMANMFDGVPEDSVDAMTQAYTAGKVNIDSALEQVENTIGFKFQLSPQEAEDIAIKVNKKLSDKEDLNNITVKATPEGIDVSYYKNVGETEEGKPIVRAVQESRKFVLDDVGGFKSSETGLLNTAMRFFISPNTVAGTADRKFFVQRAEALSYATGRVAKGYEKAFDSALAPLKGDKKKLGNLSDMLLKIDGKDVPTDYHSMVNVGYDGTRLTDEEFVSFKLVRDVFEEAWLHNNATLRRDMELKGMKSVYSDAGEAFHVKPYDSLQSASKSDVYGKNVLGADGRLLSGNIAEELETAYNNGQVLIRSGSGNQLGWFDSLDPSIGKVEYRLVDRTQIRDLPDEVLNRTPNYIPKQRKDANFFIKTKSSTKVEGRNMDTFKTVAYATTNTQAKAWKAKQIEIMELQAVEAGADTSAQAIAKRAEEFEDQLQITQDLRVSGGGFENDNEISMSGGLIFGKRSTNSDSIQFAGDATEGGRLDTYEAMQSYLQRTADKVVMTEWRLMAQQKVRRQLATLTGRRMDELPSDWSELSAVAESGKISPQAKAKWNSLYEQVSTMSKIPSKSEQDMQGLIHAMAKYYDDKGTGRSFASLGFKNQEVAKYLYQYHDKTLVDVMKSATFNLTLGMYNFVQLPVQLAGAVSAFSINPVHASKGASKWLMASVLDNVKNEKVATQALQKFSKDLGEDAKTVANDYAFWRKTGMHETIIAGNADAVSLSSRLPYDASMLRRGWDKFVQTGQMPYRAGELGNMRISFFTALEREKALKGDKFRYDDETLTNVIARAEKYRLNMGSGNKAGMQKGIWALPTQFKQIYTKFLESVAGSHLTGPERLRLFAGQIALYGGAGIPILNHWTDNFIALSGKDITQMQPEEIRVYQNGAIGWLINDYLDIDADVSSRVTQSADLIEELTRMAVDGNTPMLQTFMGASFTGGDKTYDIIRNLFYAGNHAIDELIDGGEMTPSMVESLNITARSMLSLPSSTRKWLLAWDLQNGWVSRSDGTRLYETNPEFRDVVARAFGWGSLEMKEIYKMSTANMERGKLLDYHATMFVNTLTQLDTYIEQGDETGTEGWHVSMSNMLQRRLERYNRKDRADLLTKINNKLKGSDFKEKTLKKVIENLSSDYQKASGQINPLAGEYLRGNE